MSDALGQVIKKTRKEKEFNQQVLATELYVEVRTVKWYEQNLTNIDVLYSIAKVLKVDPKTLIEKNNEVTDIVTFDGFKSAMIITEDGEIKHLPPRYLAR